ncbi:hypothetical protein PoB_005822200 [Plakobranchus ocellatus]|uniref:Uncharacterized protein n=1 Tax=Plakobranchus ocellatus TaxID=259542 RepID=A0AAV4CJM6_9GAST|nr:hypothetical protein PoB_005822200 [Plakobranchus ocellatus]
MHDISGGAMAHLVGRLAINQRCEMSVEDAQDYAKTVAMEYEQLQLQDLEEQYQLERRAFQQPLLESDFFGAGPAYNRYPNQPMDSIMPVPDSPEPGFDMLGYVNSLMSPEEQDYIAQRQLQAELLSAFNNDPYKFVTALWKEAFDNALMSPEEQDYIAQRQLQAELLSAFNNDPYKFVTALWKEAFDNGNVEAQEIVRLLYDRVRQNSNPADIREINDILMETLAQSLSEDTPYAYDTPIFPPVALPEVPIQPSVNEEAELNSQESMVGSEETKEEEDEKTEETKEEEASEEKEEEKSEEEDKPEEAKEDSNGEEENVEEKENKEDEKH